MSDRAKGLFEQLVQKSDKDPKQTITEAVTNEDNTLDRTLKNDIIEVVAEHSHEAWETFMPPVTGGRSINRIIEIGVNALDPVIQVEYESPEEGLTFREASVTTTQHNEKVGLKIPMERSLSFVKNYTTNYSEEMYRGEYLEQVGDAVEEKGLFNQYDNQALIDGYREYQKSGRLTGQFEQFVDDAREAVEDKAKEVQMGWAKRYLSYLDNQRGVHVRGVNLR